MQQYRFFMFSSCYLSRSGRKSSTKTPYSPDNPNMPSRIGQRWRATRAAWLNVQYPLQLRDQGRGTVIHLSVSPALPSFLSTLHVHNAVNSKVKPAMSTTTLVHTQETTSRNAMPDHYAAFLPAYESEEYTATAEMYWHLDNDQEGKLLQRFQTCRKTAWFVQNVKTFQIRVASQQCKLRWCPLCAAARQNYISAVTHDWLKTCRHPKLLTLTLRHTSAPLASQIDFLYASFNKLRKRKLFRTSVTAGVWFFQIKKSKTTGEWHPHIHTLIDGAYIPHGELKAIWAKITRGSDIVDIRSCKNLERTSKHIVRYAARPSDLADKTIDERLELFNALENRRLVGSWGSARSLSFKPTAPDDSEDWQNIGTWGTVKSMLGFSIEADEIWKSFTTGQPASRLITLRPLERAIEGVGDYNPQPPPVQQWLNFYDSNSFRKEG